MNQIGILPQFRHRKMLLSALSSLNMLMLLCLLLIGTADCGGGGGSGGGTDTGVTTGPGDPQNYFPWDQGNTWITRGTVVTDGTGSTTDYYAITRISGNSEILGKTAEVWSKMRIKKLASGTVIADEPRDTYLVKDSNGIAYLGNNNPLDTLTRELVPYQNAVFPLETGSGFVQLNKAEPNYNVFSRVTVQGLDNVISVPAGTFSLCAIMHTDLSATLSGETSAAVQTQWFAPGIGSVKSITKTTINSATDTNTEELIGYVQPGVSSGVTPASLTPGTLSAGIVNRNGANFYTVSVIPNSAYTVSLSEMSATLVAGLHVFNGSNGESDATSSTSKTITISGPQSVLYIIVDGFTVSAADAP